MVLEWLFDANITIIDVAIYAGIILAIVVYLEMRGRTRKPMIDYLRERDRTGEELAITTETPMIAESSRRTGWTTHDNKRFIKLQRGYTFTKHGRPITKYYGKEGVGYTWKLASPPVKITLATALKSILGVRRFNKLFPETVQAELADPKTYYVTVDLEQGYQPKERYEIVYACPTCKGEKLITKKDEAQTLVTCPSCKGTGEERELQERTLPFISEETLKEADDERAFHGFMKSFVSSVRAMFMDILPWVLAALLGGVLIGKFLI